MINCKPYRAKFKTDATCVINQCRLKKFNERKRVVNGRGDISVFLAAKPAEYYKICSCDGCKIGVKLYEKAKKEDRLPALNSRRRHRKAKVEKHYRTATDSVFV